MTEPDKKPVGRPPFKITDKVLKQVKVAASYGLTQEQIALVIGVSPATLYAKKTEFIEFMEAISEGQAHGVAKVANALFNSAIEGSVPAQKYYLATRDRENWSETINLALADVEPILSITRSVIDPPSDES